MQLRSLALSWSLLANLPAVRTLTQPWLQTLTTRTRSCASLRRTAPILNARGRGKETLIKEKTMPRGVKKENLPEKVCVVCNRPFTWRKKWERCWDEVTTCSKSCNAARRLLKKDDGSDQASSSSAPPKESEPVDDERLIRDERKAAAKAAKALKRAKREGRAPKETGQKCCDMCSRGSDLLVRCQVDETKQWKLVCGRCWKSASGGVVDGDSAHPHYRYGGLWRNRVVKRDTTHAEPPPDDELGLLVKDLERSPVM